MDMNQHVNNVKYISWVLEVCIPLKNLLNSQSCHEQLMHAKVINRRNMVFIDKLTSVFSSKCLQASHKHLGFLLVFNT